MALSVITLSIKTFSIMTLSIMTLSITTFSLMTFSMKGLYVTLSVNDTQHTNTLHNAENHNFLLL